MVPLSSSVTDPGRMQGESELKALRKLPDGLKTDELKRFYDLSQRIVELNTAVVEGVLAHPTTAKILSGGRLVVLSDGVSLHPSRFDGLADLVYVL